MIRSIYPGYEPPYYSHYIEGLGVKVAGIEGTIQIHPWEHQAVQRITEYYAGRGRFGDLAYTMKFGIFSRINIEDQGVTKLDLSDLNLGVLREEIGRLRHLERLNLNYNDLKSLPGTLADLRKLKLLHVKGNPLNESALGLLATLRTKGVKVIN